MKHKDTWNTITSLHTFKYVKCKYAGLKIAVCDLGKIQSGVWLNKNLSDKTRKYFLIYLHPKIYLLLVPAHRVLPQFFLPFPSKSATLPLVPPHPGASSHFKIRSGLTHWGQKRQLSATYASGAADQPCMLFVWWLSLLGLPGIHSSQHSFSSCGVAFSLRAFNLPLTLPQGHRTSL